jgi:hypothetical protein
MSTVRLADDQLERLADLVAERLRGQPSSGQLVSAAAIARELGVTRQWVYEHRDQLGAVRLGAKGARLRFDPERARQALDVPPTPAKPPAPRRKRRQPAAGSILKARA